MDNIVGNDVNENGVLLDESELVDITGLGGGRELADNIIIAADDMAAANEYIKKLEVVAAAAKDYWQHGTINRIKTLGKSLEALEDK